MTTTPTMWRAPFTANAANTTGAQFNPYTIGLSNGNFLTAWTDDTSGSFAGNDVFGQIFGPEGNAVGAAFQMNDSFFVDGEFLGSIAPQTDGGFVIAYVDDEGAGTNAIRIERYDAAGTPNQITSITGGAGDVSDPEITVAPDGSYMITFTRNIAGDFDVRAVVITAGNVVGAEFDAAQNSPDVDFNSDSAGLSNNNFVTVYEETDAGVTGIEAQIVTSAGANVNNVQVSATGFDAHVAALTGGGFVVVWNDPADSGDIRFTIYDNAGVPGASKVLIAGGVNSQNEPHVVRLLDGGFFVVWDNDTNGNLAGQRFSATGVSIGDKLIIDSNFSITDPEIGLTSDGRILVTYTNGAGEVSQAILDPRDNVINGTGASEVLTTQIGNTTIFGGSGLDTIFGKGGNDVIQGGFDTDSIFAGAGNDTIQVLEGEFIDNVDGQGGIDTLDLSNITSLAANINLDTGTWDVSPSFGGPATIANVEVVLGTDLGDSITGSAASETFSGGAGIDVLIGDAGNDTYVLANGSDLVSDTAGIDTITSTKTRSLASFTNIENLTLVGAAAADGTGDTLANTLTGNTAANRLSGMDGNDILTGLSGNDTLTGGLGKDVMTGGGSPDDFDFNTVAEIGNSATRDVITDFVHLSDDIDLSTIDANGAAAGNTAFTFRAAEGASFTGARGQVRWFQSNVAGTANDRTIIAGDINGDSVADFQIELTGLKTLTAGDFIL